MQSELSYQNFKKLVEHQTGAIKFENFKVLCGILECTPSDVLIVNC